MLKQVKNLAKYVYFYNHYQPQPKLKEMSLNEYRLAHLKTKMNIIL